MRTLLRLLLAICITSGAAGAHPSRGIVADPGGRVFFSDLERIWMIDPTGAVTLVRAATGAHTHELFLSPDGNLYGEDLRYDDGRFTSALWRRDRVGRITFLFGPAGNPPAGLGVVRDSRGCTYQSDESRSGAFRLYRLCPRARPQRLAGAVAAARDTLTNISGATLVGGAFYFRRGSTVQRWSSGGVRTVADGVSRENFGLAVAPNGSIYVAEYRNRRVVGIRAGRPRWVAVRSPAGWAPTGVAVHRSTLFVLEAGGSTSAPLIQVRAIGPSGQRLLARVPYGR